MQIWLCPDDLTVEAIHRVEEAVARRMGNQLAPLVSDVAVDEDVGPNFVVVPHVAWRILKIPVHIAAFGTQGNDTVGIKIVARPIFGVILRRWVPGSPEGLIGIGIIGPGDPNGAAAGLPSVVGVLP